MSQFLCPHCGNSLEVEERPASGVVACPGCGRRIRLPKALPPSPAASPQAGPGALPDEEADELRDSLPANFPEAAEQLGVPRYRVERKSWEDPKAGEMFILLAFLGVCSFALFLFSVFRIKDYFFDRAEHFAPGAGFPYINLFLGIFTCFPLWLGLWGLGVWLLLQAWRKRSVHAVVYPAGFVLWDGRRFGIWRWSDIECISMQGVEVISQYMFIETGRCRTRVYVLRHRDGTTYSFVSTQGPRAAQFGLQVEQETYRLMLPEAEARLRAGKSVTFAPFKMRPDGLVYKDRLTPWSRVGPAWFQKGALHLDGLGPRGKDLSVALGDIENSHVFLELLGRKVEFEHDE